MKVKFLRDFRGKETKERFFKKGQVADLDDQMADVLFRGGIAEFAEGKGTMSHNVEPQFEQPEPPAVEEKPVIRRKRGRQ
jgi:hypothetical protein